MGWTKAQLQKAYAMQTAAAATTTAAAPAAPAPVNCVGAWTNWSNCASTTCDGINAKSSKGTRSREFKITTERYYTGKDCNPIKETTETDNTCTNDCAVHCVGEWSPWSECYDTNCDGISAISSTGKQLRTYTIKTNPSTSPKGNDCPAKDYEQETNTTCRKTDCPVNCVGEWSKWTDCINTKCDGIKTTSSEGTRSKTYKITTNPSTSPKGEECPIANNKTETETCRNTNCPIDCVGGWTDWTNCINTTCDGNNATSSIGTRSRKYIIKTNPSTSPKGNDCPEKNNRIDTDNTCTNTNCPINCIGGWSNWTDCANTTCDGINATSSIGTRSREYTITTDPSINPKGKVCPEKNNRIETDNTCKITDCPVDCSGNWSDWSDCANTTCNTNNATSTSIIGTGTRTRKYTIIRDRDLNNKGIACPEKNNALDRDNTCTNTNCPVNCVGAWSNWTDCSANCDGINAISTGTRKKIYKITKDMKNKGRDCFVKDNTPVIETCIKTDCPVNCVGEWSNWTDCIAECDDINATSTSIKGTGTRTRIYTIKRFANGGGEECDVSNNKIDIDLTCTNTSCPVDCSGNWSDWSDCSANCDGINAISTGTGIRSRTYTITTPADNEGEACTIANNTIDKDPTCRKTNCPVNCIGDWSNWSDCSANCDGINAISIKGTGIRSRTYTITTPADNNGEACTIENNATETDPLCTKTNCLVDCSWNNWSPWSDCSANTGKKIRKIDMTIKPLFNGKECPEPITEDCQVDCSWNNWGDWSNCNANTGKKIRKIDMIIAPLNNGTKCPEPETEDCQVDCSGNWTPWTKCNANTGKKTRIFDKIRGTNCPETETEDCQVDCIGVWGLWGDCNANTGKKTRIFDKIQGTSCPEPETEDCQVDCSGSWGKWSECNANTGKKTRIFNKIQGTSCPEPETEDCKVDCSGSWGKWSECNANTGKKTRIFNMTISPFYNIASCPKPETEDCSIECILSESDFTEWSEWSECNCNTKISTRSKKVINNTNLNCKDIIENKDCNNEEKCLKLNCESQKKYYNFVTKECDNGTLISITSTIASTVVDFVTNLIF